MLEVKNLTRRYGSFVAVDNVSFTIGNSAIVGLLGHNGAGKTTIMKILSGYLEPDAGSVTVAGVSLADDPKKVQSGLGYLPENLPFYPEMTVADYLDYAADIKGLGKAIKRAEIRRAIADTDISAKLLAPISTLSRGYRQRLGVAQAILGQPKLLILDEPTNGLDPEQTHHMRQLIRDIARQATVILSTHIMQEVDAICSRALILRSGQLAMDAELEDLRRSHSLLVDTTLSPLQARQLSTIQGLASLGPVNTAGDDKSGYRYRLNLEENADPRQVGAQVVGKIVAMEQQLFSLQPEHRDLETLFREVTEQTHPQGDLVHAA